MAIKVAILAFIIHDFLFAAALVNNSASRSFRATMIRRHAIMNFTRVAQQSHERSFMLAARRLDSAAGGVSTQTPLRADMDGVEYNMEISIGTPPQRVSAMADTGSDLVWATYRTCASCTPQGSPAFDPTKSSSFSKLECSDRLCKALQSHGQGSCGGGGGGSGTVEECDYKYTYGSGDTQGFMGTDTITVGDDTVQGVGVGCSTSSNGNIGTASGIVGLGRGDLSLVSQLGVSVFSYCLIRDPSKASPLLFGSLATMTGTGTGTGTGIQSTRLLAGLSNTYYSVSLKSISIGSVTTPGTRDDGVVFDSGTTLTLLADPAYTSAKQAILSETSLPPAGDRGPFELCFQASGNDISGSVPPMVLQFDGADMNLPAANYFLEVESGVICWVVQRSPLSPPLSIIGNIMQMNYQIQYDLGKNMLSFQPANCETL